MKLYRLNGTGTFVLKYRDENGTDKSKRLPAGITDRRQAINYVRTQWLGMPAMDWRHTTPTAANQLGDAAMVELERAYAVRRIGALVALATNPAAADAEARTAALLAVKMIAQHGVKLS